MSIWFMADNHTFLRLDTLAVDEAMDQLESAVDAQGGSGFVATKGMTPYTVIQWRKGEPWRGHVRALLAQHARQEPPAAPDGRGGDGEAPVSRADL